MKVGERAREEVQREARRLHRPEEDPPQAHQEDQQAEAEEAQVCRENDFLFMRNRCKFVCHVFVCKDSNLILYLSRSRTLQAVHTAILDDLVYPAEIVGKRIRLENIIDSTRTNVYPAEIVGKRIRLISYKHRNTDTREMVQNVIEI